MVLWEGGGQRAASQVRAVWDVGWGQEALSPLLAPAHPRGELAGLPAGALRNPWALIGQSGTSGRCGEGSRVHVGLIPDWLPS